MHSYADIGVPSESVMLMVVASQSITHTTPEAYLTYQMQELQCQALAVGLHAASLHICTTLPPSVDSVQQLQWIARDMHKRACQGQP